MPNDKLEKVPQPGPNQALSPTDLTGDIVLRFINKNADAKEIMFFLQQCASLDLNPFLREIFLIKYSPTDIGQIVIAYNVFIARAERSLRLKGWRTWVDYAADDPNQTKDPIRAHIEIFRADWEKPFVHSVRFTEYIGYKGDGSVTKMWKTKAETMIRKVVTAQGFRLCFPDELGDLPFTTEELGQEEPDHNAPTGPLPTAKVEVYVKPKSEAPKPEPKTVDAEVVKPTGLTKEERELLEKAQARHTAKMSEQAPPPDPAPPEAKPTKPATPPAPAKKPAPASAPAKSTPAKVEMVSEAQKERILALMGTLEKDYGKDPADMFTVIMDRLLRIFGKRPENFPDDLSDKQASFVLGTLNATLKSEEQKKAAENEEAI